MASRCGGPAALSSAHAVSFEARFFPSQHSRRSYGRLAERDGRSPARLAGDLQRAARGRGFGHDGSRSPGDPVCVDGFLPLCRWGQPPFPQGDLRQDAIPEIRDGALYELDGTRAQRSRFLPPLARWRANSHAGGLFRRLRSRERSVHSGSRGSPRIFGAFHGCVFRLRCGPGGRRRASPRATPRQLLGQSAFLRRSRLGADPRKRSKRPSSPQAPGYGDPVGPRKTRRSHSS